MAVQSTLLSNKNKSLKVVAAFCTLRNFLEYLKSSAGYSEVRWQDVFACVLRNKNKNNLNVQRKFLFIYISSLGILSRPAEASLSSPPTW